MSADAMLEPLGNVAYLRLLLKFWQQKSFQFLYLH